MEASNNGNSWKNDSLNFYAGNSSTSSESKKSPLNEENLVNDQHRIGFLNQCKLELSAEVIRWKEENLRLQKENEAAAKKIEDLQSIANRLARQNHELEAMLFVSQEENKVLKMKTLTMGEENSVLHKELSKTKYHSYPWIDLRNTTPSSTVEYFFNDSASGATESWEELTRKLFQQMQKEMREMQKLSQTLAERDKIFENMENVAVSNSSTALKDTESSFENEVMEEKINNMTSEVETLKQQLKYQNEKLRYLLRHFLQDVEHKKQVKNSDIKQQGCASTKTVLLPNQSEIIGATDENKTHCCPSDETFRAYFTKQLTKCGSEDKTVTQVYLNKEETTASNGSHTPIVSSQNSFQKGINQRYSVVSGQKDPARKPYDVSLITEGEKRVCPICETAFPKHIPDNEFEAHVMEHLKAFGATLLDQYEVLS